MGGEFLGKYKVGVTDGKIVGVKYELHKNGGWSNDCSPSIMATALYQLDGSYAIPHFEAVGESYQSNTPSNTAFRAYGAPPAHIISENMVYDVCSELGLDPIEFRKANFQQEGFENHFGQVMTATDVTMEKCFDTILDSSKYYDMKTEVEAFNASNKLKKRGLYIIPNKYGVGAMGPFAQGTALVNIFLDGSVLVCHQGVECGQGLHTKMLQIVSQELAIPMSKIRISESGTDKIPNPIPTGGSTSADLAGNALKDACDQINQRLAPLKAAKPEAPWEMIVGMAFGTKVNLSAIGHWGLPGQNFNPATGTGNRWWYYTTGASCSLTEIDVLTGESTLLKVNLMMDVGESINPAIDVSQIEAAFMQGYGWVSMEDTKFSDDGKLISRGHDEYNMPTIADCPREFNVTLLRGNTAKEHVLYSSKGIGEPPFFNGASVYFAVKDAVLAARKDAGLSGQFSLELPANAKSVREACGRGTRRSLVNGVNGHSH